MAGKPFDYNELNAEYRGLKKLYSRKEMAEIEEKVLLMDEEKRTRLLAFARENAATEENQKHVVEVASLIIAILAMTYSVSGVITWEMIFIIVALLLVVTLVFGLSDSGKIAYIEAVLEVDLNTPQMVKPDESDSTGTSGEIEQNERSSEGCARDEEAREPSVGEVMTGAGEQSRVICEECADVAKRDQAVPAGEGAAPG